MPIVSIRDTDKTFDVKEGEILYDSICDRGYELPHGCLSGSCGACRVEVLEGKENLIPAGVIENNTIEALKDEFKKVHGEEFLINKEIRLSCRAKVTGDVTIRPIK
ncbi:MAG: (2Fe-2S)-binding protein [Bdellovibrionales bacterium]|nr:(2Fe-2S)-binding protein [Bdellovibrionales bacterium]